MSRRLEGLLSVLFLAFFLLPNSPLRAAGEIKDEDYVIESLQKRYDSTVDFVAEFRQETEFKTLNRTLKAWGKLYFKRPGRMLWRYEEPKGQIVMADGESLYFYQPEDKQVLKIRLSKAFLSDTPLSFLLGIGELKRDFKGTITGSEEGVYVLRLSPKDGLGEIGRLFLGLEKKHLDILWARIVDAVGNVTTIRFNNMQRGVGLKDSLFRLDLPEDVDTVELGKP
ncbi:MAG: outer membrane lipoprotein carrier protein LolA [Deltaproteobacteria bacterium]|nr:outer membrane lipoprotein carrier protein LolA [Deltaproteobacteria bacterium]